MKTFHQDVAKAVAYRIAQSVDRGNYEDAMEHFAYLLNLKESVDADFAFDVEPFQQLLDWLPESDERRSELVQYIADLNSTNKSAELRKYREKWGSASELMLRDDGTYRSDDAKTLAASVIANTKWPLEPLFYSDWESLQGSDAEELFNRFGVAIRENHHLSAIRSVGVRAIRQTPLSFYHGGMLCEFLLNEADDFEGPRSIAAIVTDDGVSLMDGKSPVIHYLNANLPIRLTSMESAASYLRFFCGCVHGEEGPFAIVGSPGELATYVDETDEVIGGLWTKAVPFEVRFEDSDGARKIQAKGTVQYSSGLFVADFRVNESGMVEMTGDEPIAGDLPVRFSQFEGIYRRRKTV